MADVLRNALNHVHGSHKWPGDHDLGCQCRERLDESVSGVPDTSMTPDENLRNAEKLILTLATISFVLAVALEAIDSADIPDSRCGPHIF